MFSEACRKASEFTRPLVVSTRRQDGTVAVEMGSFTVLNDDGWVMTAGHMFDSFAKFQTDTNKVKEVREINDSRKSRISVGSPNPEIKPDPSLIINHSFWWSWDGVRMERAHTYRQIDIAICKLTPFNSKWISEYPVLSDSKNVVPGKMLCRAGFPFVDIRSEWDDVKKAFRIPAIPNRELCFFNEGMCTRIVSPKNLKKDGLEPKFIEMSTPGLKGQSGGPIFDADGKICGLQSRTESRPLGFHPTLEYGGSTAIEHQFINLGIAVHVSTVRELLDRHGIRCASEGDEFRILS